MIKEIKEIHFPNGTISQATVTQADMGEWSISATIKADGDVTPDFSEDWAVEYEGVRYVMPLRTPAARKENTSFDSEFDLTFQHFAQRELQRWMFFTVQPVESSTAIPDKYEASVSLTLGDLIILFGQVLEYYYGDKITIELNPAWEYSEEPTLVEISYSYVWDVLLKLYELYKVRWNIVPNGDSEHYAIKVGYGAEEINHIFEYGFEGGFLKVERQIQDTDIRNMLLGRGGEKNLPYRYFKDVDPNNPSFPADPDWIPELRNIYFDRLRGKTFRDYIKGWKTNPRRQLKEADGTPIKPYGSNIPIKVEDFDAEYARDSFAYLLGHTDEKFNPVEYVADRLVVADLRVIPEEDSSIDRYGPMLGGLDDNDEIYPTIRGVIVDPYGRIDQTVDVEQILSDETVQKPNDAEKAVLPAISGSVEVPKGTRQWIEITGGQFIIPEGKYGDLDEGAKKLTVYRNSIKTIAEIISGRWYLKSQTFTIKVEDSSIMIEDATLAVIDSKGEEIASSGIPAGVYKYRLKARIYNPDNVNYSATLSCPSPILITATPDEENPDTFDIWVKNIWQTGIKPTETDRQYAERVWIPILGDRTGEEAKVVFASGWLATSEGYEFTIVKTPVYDTSRIIDGVPSHWRITCAKCDADMDATGLPVPSTQKQGNAGDYFFFIGIDMPHIYVLWAERRLDEYKESALPETRDVKPTWVVTPDRVRFNNLQPGEVSTLLSRVYPGMAVTLRDKRFIPGSQQETLYLQSMTITYREPTSEDAALNPDIEFTLGNDYAVSASPIETIQGRIDSLSQQMYANMGSIEQAVRAYGDRRFLSKARADRTPYLLSSDDGFEAGRYVPGVSGAVMGIDSRTGGSYSELDRMTIRQQLTVMELLINQMSVQQGDSLFTEGDTIDTCEPDLSDTATLTDGITPVRWWVEIQPRYEGYITGLRPGMVLMGKVNNLFTAATEQTPADYYTVFMRVNGAELGTSGNRLNVTLYDDLQTPAGRNFAPCALMTLARWGHQTEAAYQRLFRLDSHDGYLARYEGVDKPIIDIGNLAMFIGRCPKGTFAHIPGIQEGDEIGYFKTLLGNIIQIDHMGNPVPDIVDAGEYDPTRAYRYRSYDSTERRWITEKVWYRGCSWLCMADGLTGVTPGYGVTQWAFKEGNPTFSIGFEETAICYTESQIRQFGATLTLTATLYNQDVLSHIPANNITWRRESYDSNGALRAVSDAAWTPTTDSDNKRLLLSFSDLDYDGTPISKISFICTAAIDDVTVAQAAADFS